MEVGNLEEQASLEINQTDSLEDDEHMFDLSRNTSFVSAPSSLASFRSSSSLSDAVTIRSDFSFGRHIGAPEIEEITDYRWLPFSSRWDVDGSGTRRMPVPGIDSSNSPVASSQAHTRGRQMQESVEPIRLFTVREIQKATNNFDQSRLIGHNGYTKLYRGTIPGFDRPVAIKVPEHGERNSVSMMINIIVIHSRINHRNVVNLIGVCLEDERLCAVYEFYPNGTLESNLFNGHMPWEARLKAAAEIAGALAYIHSSLSNPIIHRDIKPNGIHLDSDYTSKIFDFEIAKVVPGREDHVSTVVCGTFGYLDPEYLETYRLTCKADVYSFGVSLVQLLTRRRAVDHEARLVLTALIASFGGNRMEQIFDTEIVNEDTLDQMKHVADLAMKCLNVIGEMRPSMVEVAMALEQLMVDNSFPSHGNNVHHSQSNNAVISQPSFSTRNTNKPIYSKIFKWMRNRQKREFQTFIENSIKDSLERYKIYTMKEIRKATNNFDNREILGKGKSVVFRGKLLDNKLCAIKKSVCHDSAEELLNEINFLSQFRHKNIVGLLGFCKEADYPITIHEYMANGALSNHVRSNSMSWELRLRISVDVAKALSYLHSSLSTPIIHGDVKASNILLDVDHTAKLSDFGLASKLNMNGQSHVSNIVHGIGNLDPEYGFTGCLTCKSDVYSFGVVLAQLLTGKEAVLQREDIGSVTLAEHFIQLVENDSLHSIAYCDIVDDVFADQIKEAADLARRCLSLVGNDRPSMAQVAFKLEQWRNEWLYGSYNEEQWRNEWLYGSYNDEDTYNADVSDCGNELSDTDVEELAR